MLIKRFKNGNFNAKREPGEELREGVLVHLIQALQDYDCQIFGEEYCLSNYEMAVDMYCYYNDLIIRIPYNLLNDLENYKTVKLYAHAMDECEREIFTSLTLDGEL